MKEKSKLRTLLWLIFPLGLLLGCMGDRNSARWSITIIILGVSLILSLIYFLSRKKAVGISAVIIAFLGIAAVFANNVPDEQTMYGLIWNSLIFSLPIIAQGMRLLVTAFSKISYEIAGRYIWEWAFAGAVYVLPALFVMAFYLRTKKCFKLIDVEAKRAARQQQRMSNVQMDAVQTQSAATQGRQGLEQLKKLGELHRMGALTDEEFQQKKTEILGKM